MEIKKKTLFNALAFSVGTAVLAASLIAGSTYALFSDTAESTIVITSGKVDIEAAVTDFELYSPTAISSEEGNEILDSANAADGSEKTFGNGGTASLTEDGTLTLTGVTPGDRVTFTLSLTNKSNISIRYRLTASAVESTESADNSPLFAVLVTTVNESPYTGLASYASAWSDLVPKSQSENGTQVATVNVSVELPAAAGNIYQGMSCTYKFAVEAVQANIGTENDEVSVTYYADAAQNAE